MVKYSVPIKYDFDYDQLLKDAEFLSDYQVLEKRTGSGTNYRKAEEGDEITLTAYKLSLMKNKAVKDLEPTKRIINQCETFLHDIGSYDFDIILIEYDETMYLGWHIDNPPEADHGRINIVVTDNWEETPIIFRDEDGEVECPAKLAVVNSYRYEHKYDNRGRGKRILLCMTTHDLNYERCIDATSSFRI